MIKRYGQLLLALCLGLMQNAQADPQEWTARTPPPNDTGLYAEKATPIYTKHKKVKRKRHHHPHHGIPLRTSYIKPQRGQIDVYMALPAPACCGPVKVTHHYHCCAKTGAWPSNNYADFNPGPDDFEYGPTNDDDMRTNEDWKLTGFDESDL